MLSRNNANGGRKHETVRRRVGGDGRRLRYAVRGRAARAQLVHHRVSTRGTRVVFVNKLFSFFASSSCYCVVDRLFVDTAAAKTHRCASGRRGKETARSARTNEKINRYQLRYALKNLSNRTTRATGVGPEDALGSRAESHACVGVGGVEGSDRRRR